MGKAKRVCKTPGAMFHLAVDGEGVAFSVVAGVKNNLTEKEAKALEDNLHDAVEEILAPLYLKGGT